MGKSRKNRKPKDLKFSPIGEDEDEIIEDENEIIEDVDTFKEILEDLVSSSEDKRESACISISELVSEPEALNTLITNGSIYKVCQLLLDPTKDVRVAAAGALRNTTICGGFEISEKLVENDIMTPLFAALLETMKLLKNETEASLLNLAQIIYLLSFLCESSEKATNLTTKYQDIIPMFLTLLTFQKCDNELLIASAQCLLVISDENSEFTELWNSYQKGSGTVELVKMIADESKPLLFRINIVGVLFNTSKEPLKVISHVSNLLLNTLQFDSISTLSQIFTKLDENKLEDEKYQQWLNFTKSQKLSIELFANMVSFVEGDSDQKLLLLKKIFETCEKASQANQIMSNSTVIEDDLILIDSLITVGVACVENILYTVSPKFFSNIDCSKILNYSFTLLNKKDEELLSSVTGLIWELVPYCTLSNNQAEIIAKLCFASEEETKINCLGILGDFGRSKHTKEQNISLAKIFIAKLSDTSMKVVCKGLDCIFDVYNDTTWNQVVLEINMIQRLKEFVGVFETRMKSTNFKNDPDLQEVCEETKMNLVEFIKYKINEMK